MFSRTSRYWMTTVTLGAFLAAGCTKTRVASVGRMEAPGTQQLQSVRYSGEYVAKWTPSNKKKLKTIPGSSRFVHAGDQLGFEYTEDGQLLAVHEDARIALANMPAGARYVVWQNKQKVKTQFARECEKAGQATGQVLLIGGIVTVIGLVIYNNPDEFADFVSHALTDKDEE